MKITINQILSGNQIPDSSFYLIYGEPFHLINEVYSSIKRRFSKDYRNTTHHIEADSPIDELRNNIESTSLFSEKIMITLNILSPSIPKNLSTYFQDMNIHKDIVMIAKINTPNASLKKSKSFSHIEKKFVAIEVKNLKGQYLNNWISKRLNNSGLKHTNKSIEMLRALFDGNTSALSQEIYKMSLDTSIDVDTHLKSNSKHLKYSEFDLVDAILGQDRSKGIEIIKHLRESNFSEVYLLHLLQSEVRKFLYIREKIEPLPYIPSFKINQYSKIADSLDTNNLENLLSSCFQIDKYIKSSSNYNYVWDNFERIFIELTHSRRSDYPYIRVEDYGY